MNALLAELIILHGRNTTKRVLLSKIADGNMSEFLEVISNDVDKDDESSVTVFKYKDKYYSFISTTNSYNYEPSYIVKSLREVFPKEKVVTVYE